MGQGLDFQALVCKVTPLNFEQSIVNGFLAEAASHCKDLAHCGRCSLKRSGFIHES